MISVQRGNRETTMNRLILGSLLAWLALAVQTSGQTLNSVEISLQGPAKFVVSDPVGRTTGVDPIKAKSYSDIPGATYGTGGADSEDPNTPGFVTEEFGCTGPVNGTYTLRVIGMELGSFELYVVLYRGVTAGRDFKFIGVTTRGQEIEYSFDYWRDTSKALVATKLVRSSSLSEDLSNCYKLKLLGQRELYSDLSHRVDKFEKYLSHRDSLEARHELLKLKEKIDDVYKKSEKRVDKKKPVRREFISEDAYKILDEDIASLLQQLPEHRKGKGWEKRDEKGNKEKGKGKGRD